VEDSIEERILSLQERKKDIFNNLVDNPEATVKKLDTEALSYILE
jgi:SNF2 family DNA or RNA helicase